MTLIIQRAAKLRPRHRAKTQSNKATVLSICQSDCSVYLSICPLRLLRIHPKSFQMVAKMVQNRGLEGCWAALGHLLGGSWAAPSSKAPLGRFLEAI